MDYRKIIIKPDKKITSYFETNKVGIIIYLIVHLGIILALLITTDLEFTFYSFLFYLLISLLFYSASKRKKDKGELISIEFDIDNNVVTIQILNEKDEMITKDISLLNLRIEEVAYEWSDTPSYHLAFYNIKNRFLIQGPDKYWSKNLLQSIYKTYQSLK